MNEFRQLARHDGKFAFDIPVDGSSSDPEIRKLDQITMEKFLDAQGLTCKPLRWSVNYRCADVSGLFPFATDFETISNPLTISIVVAILVLPQVTHYVLDGFIWRFSKDSSAQIDNK